MTASFDKKNTKLMQGLALHHQGKLAEAKALYESCLKQQPNNPDVLHLMGIVLAQLKQSARAIELFDQAIKIKPNDAGFHCNRGNAFFELNKFAEAIKDYDQAIDLVPSYLEAYFNRANAWFSMGEFHEASLGYEQVINFDAAHAQSWRRRSVALANLGSHKEAIACLDRLIFLCPDDAEAYYHKGIAFHALQQRDAAIESYQSAVGLKHDYIDALNNLGIVLSEKERFEDALDVFNKIVELKPDNVQAYNNLGSILSRQGRHKEALLIYEKAIQLRPDYYDVHLNAGLALAALARYESAIKSYNQAISSDPEKPEPYYNRALAFQALKYYEQALVDYEKAISLRADYSQAHHNKGIALFVLKRWAEAISSFQVASKIKPDIAYLDGMVMHNKMWLCDWQEFYGELKKLTDGLMNNKKVSLSFPVLTLIDSLKLHRKAAEIWISSQFSFKSVLGEIPKRSRREKIRLGYFSADFRQHPVSILLAELFEAHDRERFELFAFSTGPDTQDAMRQRVKVAFDHFIDITHLPDKDAAQLVRQWSVDIAIDLGGHTQDARTGIFSYRAAPIQLSYIGYLGTMGADYYDYLLADRMLIPESSQAQYTEKIAYLLSYQVSDSKRVISDRVFSRKELGLPEHGVVFCCFNNNYKITPDTFEQWMNILRQVPNSVLVLYVESSLTRDNLAREAQQRGVDSVRIIFAERLPYEQHLARYRVMDIFLDTLPYNAGATASDALWAGLPVITQMGESFPSRYAASLLTAIDLPELITDTSDAYVKLAVDLATYPEKLKKIKDKLEYHRFTTLLFDTPKFTRHLEAAYQAMYDRYQADLSPDHLVVEA